MCDFQENFDNSTKINKKIIFTCTTYLKNNEKYEILNKTLDTFIKHNKDDLHLIDDFFIIMEFTQFNDSYLEKLKNKYPIIKFIVKKEYEKGHSKSINIIINKLKDYKYWFHWEDSWYSTGPTLKECYEIMENTNINNYQLTKREILYDMPVINNEYITCSIIENKYKTIKANYKLKNLWRYWEINNFDFTIWKDYGLWPFYSLRPSISKVNTILNAGYHSEDIIKWPFQCEFEWALKWVRKNDIIIGIPRDIKVERKDTHVSSYGNDEYQRWLKKLENREEKEKYNRDVSYNTLKSDKKEIIIFWTPGFSCNILKTLIYNLEEEFPFKGDDITKEIGNLNYNKYFVEINSNTLEKFKKYKKILVTKDNLIKIPKEWIDEIIDVNNINLLINRYDNTNK